MCLIKISVIVCKSCKVFGSYPGQVLDYTLEADYTDELFWCFP